MKIFSENADSVKREIDLLKDSFIKTKQKRIIDNIEMLESYYQVLFEISGEEDLETADILLKNKKLRDKKFEERQRLHKKNINNFIENKDMHGFFSGKILDLYNEDFKYFTPKKLSLNEENMAEIICEFLDEEFNQADKFIELAKNGCIFKAGINPDTDSVVETAGYTIYNYVTKNSTVVVSNDPKIWDVNMMRILVHEFGHVSDNFDRNNVSRNRNSQYYWLSSYAEVYSMLYEKLFFDYLIKNNIYKENALTGLKRFYIDIYDNFNSVEYLSSLDDNLLVNERYKQKNNLADQIQIDENGNPYISSAVLDNFNETKLYSYGGILASYFAKLKHDDIEKFKKNFVNFKQKRFGLFDFNIFEEIGTNVDEIIKIYNEGLMEVTESKKLILK